MPDERPDPDLLLARVQAEEARQARGKLKIFFGAAPGVGKTYSMLEAGRKQGKEGVDVVIGYVEPHVRPETQALVLGLDVLPRKEIQYRGTKLLEFDLDAALARRPQLVLVDELAHTNAPGMLHAKRWQDVEALLAAGIDVYSTLNVQHLESLNDIIAQITGVTVRETVPDFVFEQADEIELVDLAPDDLLERMREGKVYVAQQAARAIENFFQKGNLIALRELALRRTAERVDAQMAAYRQEHAVQRTWPAADRLLVCVGSSPMSPRLVRATRRMATSLKATWIAVHVETQNDARASAEDRERLAHTLNLAEQLGGATATLSGHDVAEEVLQYARTHNVTRIIVGKPQATRWRELFKSSYVYDLTRKCGDIDVYVISGDDVVAHTPSSPRPQAQRNLLSFLGAIATVAVCSGVGLLFQPYLALSNLIMVYLLGVVTVAVRYGRGESTLAAVLSVLAFDFFFVPPILTFSVSDAEYLLTFGVMLITGLVISTLTNRVKFQAQSAREREQRTSALYAMSRELVEARTKQEIVDAAARHLGSALASDVFLLSHEPTAHNAAELTLFVATGATATLEASEIAVARWVFDHGERAGRSTDTLPAAQSLFLPLKARHETVGVLGIRPILASWSILTPDQMRFLETFAGQLALTLERIRIGQQVQQTQLEMQTERLRHSLFSAISHDLRTPLAAIMGASSTLIDGGESLSHAMRQELASSIFDESERLNRLVGNLLEMTRLEAGALAIRKEWYPLDEIIGSVLRRMKRQLADRTVDIHLPPNLPLVPLDQLLIEQVLVNLIENAVKYTPRDSPIEISAAPQDGAVMVQIADRGPGIAQEELAVIFDKFYRSSGVPGPEGVGLGLAICRGIIDLHGGRIWAERRDGGGTAFRFTLPLEGTPPKIEMEETPSSEAAGT